jgi:REP element-mobilizing transposase RayT
MPRKSRLDAPGAVHHIIVRGIDRGLIFRDAVDRHRFIERLGALLAETGTACYAWALLSNHFHLLVRSGHLPLSGVMRRLLTGYAISFNRRHRRWGHLFQNRYKSILCQPEPYLLELVRYIHLNPLRARLVAGLEGQPKSVCSGSIS